MPVLWQRDFYHITMAFIDDTQHLSDVEAIMHKYLDNTGRFNAFVKKRKGIHLTLISPFGVKKNIYQFSVQNVITADDLFKE